jgi:hypothetical protein
MTLLLDNIRVSTFSSLSCLAPEAFESRAYHRCVAKNWDVSNALWNLLFRVTSSSSPNVGDSKVDRSTWWCYVNETFGKSSCSLASISMAASSLRGPQKSDLLELLTQIRQGKLSSCVRLERLQVYSELALPEKTWKTIKLSLSRPQYPALALNIWTSWIPLSRQLPNGNPLLSLNTRTPRRLDIISH